MAAEPHSVLPRRLAVNLVGALLVLAASPGPGRVAAGRGAPDDPRAGYPWTQLGATYDWSPSSGNHQGPSELVLHQGAQSEVVSAGSASDYCDD